MCDGAIMDMVQVCNVQFLRARAPSINIIADWYRNFSSALLTNSFSGNSTCTWLSTKYNIFNINIAVQAPKQNAGWIQNFQSK